MPAATWSVARLAGGAILRGDERALLISAGGVFALASAGAAMTAAAADAMFLSELGAGHLGEAVAASSALLAVVLAVIGGLADRLERRRVLASLSIVSAVVIAGLAALSIVMPRAAAAITLVGGKQLAAATDLAFWVVIAERLDARRSQRLVPLLAAAGGAGAAVGAVLVIPLAPAVGARGVLVTAALVLVLAGIGAARMSATRRVAAPPARLGALIARSWRDGARAVRRYPLAMHLAVVVAAAGVFASLAYFALGVAVANLGDSTADRTALLGGVRGVGQIITLVVQLALASRLLTRLGTGRTLLLAPLVALASGLGLVVAPILAVAIATQVSARVLDGGVETPAEKLAQTLLPTAVRGRVAGFLDGPAKRAGAVAGGLVAAALAGVPTAFYVSTAVAAALWFLAARRIARELPTLAVEHVVGTADADAVVDDRAIAELLGELASDRIGGRFTRERAAEVLVRLHERGRVDAVPPLVRAVVERPSPALWRSLIAVLDVPADAHGPALAAIASAGDELAIRAIGLAGGVAPEVVAGLASRDDLAVALAVEIAGMRLAGETDEVVARLGDAIRDSGPAARVAVSELAIEIARALAADAIESPGSAGARSNAQRCGDAIESPGSAGARSNAQRCGDAIDRAVDAARHVSRALRRRRGDVASRTAGFVALARVIIKVRERRDAELSLLRADLLEVVRERVESGASKPAPDHMLVSVMRTPDTASIGDDAPELAAAIALYGALLDGADAVDPDDLRRIARALGEPDDEVSAAAEDALGTLGGVAAGELVATVAWGRRRARDRAAALLAQLPVTAASLDRLIDDELDTLDRTHAAIAALGAPGDQLVARRLDERLHEIAHTVLLLVAAQRRSPAIARAAIAWRHARGGQERARALAVIDAALPRALVGRLVEAVDDLTPADRAAQLAAADQTGPDRDAVMRAELAGRDRLSRALALHVIGSAGRSAHRDAIASAAHAEARAANPRDLLRRLTEAVHDRGADEPSDMPSRVETLIALGRVPLLAALTSRQLADVAERARWVSVAAGAIVISAGDLVDALIVVDDGELAQLDRRIGKGEVVDELACVAPVSAAGDVRAVRASRMIRLERVDFEELVDDVPGLASAVCRALGERARRADIDHVGYKSPLTSRA